jgi:hypothetical protein
MAHSQPGHLMTDARVSPRNLVAWICIAQVLVQLGAFFWPALLPGLITRWGLTNSEAGWIIAVFYGAYIVAVPVLVTLTDRLDPKHLPLWRRDNGPRTLAVWPLCRWILVCNGGARADRHRLGRNIHDRTQTLGRPCRRCSRVTEAIVYHK